VEFGKDYKAKRRVIVKAVPVGDEAGLEREYLVPKGKHVSVQEGDYVKAATRWWTAPACRTTSCACWAWKRWRTTW
jgi:hypothetical protein